MTPYAEDLAFIHDAGFGALAEAAARALVADLTDAGLRAGKVAELGCGPGASSRLLVDAGFDVLGFDSSPAMIARARRRVPEAEFRVGTFVAAELPPCVAVTAFGEVLNYAFDAAHLISERQRLFARVNRALRPGGLFVFDLAGRDRAPAGGRSRSFQEGDGWAVLVETLSDAGRRRLTRRIVSFRRDDGPEQYRRREEVHLQLLAEPSEVLVALETAGFDVTTADAYGDFALPQGLTVFRARRAPRPADVF